MIALLALGGTLARHANEAESMREVIFDTATTAH
jgi:hypothetical protein